MFEVPVRADQIVILSTYPDSKNQNPLAIVWR